MTHNMYLICRLIDGSLAVSSTTWNKDRNPTKSEWDDIKKSVAVDLNNQHFDVSDFTIVSFSLFPQLDHELSPSQPGRTAAEQVHHEFFQVGYQYDVVGQFFGKVGALGDKVEVKEFPQSCDRVSLLKRDNRTIAFAIETRTEFNDLEFIYGTVGDSSDIPDRETYLSKLKPGNNECK